MKEASKARKGLLAVMLSLVLAATMVPAMAFADEVSPEEANRQNQEELLSLGLIDEVISVSENDLSWIEVESEADGSFDLMATADAMKDLSRNAWYMTEGGGYVPYAVKNGLMTGYSDTAFGPGDNITRGQVATIIYRYASPQSTDTSDKSNYAKTNTTGLSDVKTGQYYTAAVNWAQANGIITGYTDSKTFKPDANVTRQELATMIARFANYQDGHTYNLYGANNNKFRSLIDYRDAASWANAGLTWCTDKGIIGGKNLDGTFYLKPNDTATRAEMAKMITVLTRDIFTMEFGYTIQKTGTGAQGVKISSIKGGKSTVTIPEKIKGINVVEVAITSATAYGSLDVSKAIHLTRIWCYKENVCTLDVSNNTALTSLAAYEGMFNKLVFGTKNTKLTYLEISGNQLKSLDISKLTGLTSLRCSNNYLTALDISKNTNLSSLYCDGNSIKNTSALEKWTNVYGSKLSGKILPQK